MAAPCGVDVQGSSRRERPSRLEASAARQRDGPREQPVREDVLARLLPP